MRLHRGSSNYGSWAFVGPAYIRWLDYDHEDSCLWSVKIGALEVSWRLPAWRYEAWRVLQDKADAMSLEWFIDTDESRFYTLAEAREALANEAAA